MKKRLMIALVILALVFGMVLTACDDGELPKIVDVAGPFDYKYTLDKMFVPYLDEFGNIQNEGDTNKLISPYYLTDADGNVLRFKVDEDGKFVDKDGNTLTSTYASIAKLVKDPNGQPYEVNPTDTDIIDNEVPNGQMSQMEYLLFMMSSVSSLF